MEQLTTPLHPDYATGFVGFLDPDEYLLWYGQPRQGIYLRRSDALAIPFSIMWGGFAIFWECCVLFGLPGKGGGGAPLLFKLWGIPFVVFGLYLMVGRFFVDANRRSNTWYGVTNRRALIISGCATRRLTSYVLSSLPEIELIASADGSGTIRFGNARQLATQIGKSSGPSFEGESQTAFERIIDAAMVYHFVRQVQNATCA